MDSVASHDIVVQSYWCLRYQSYETYFLCDGVYVTRLIESPWEDLDWRLQQFYLDDAEHKMKLLKEAPL